NIQFANGENTFGINIRFVAESQDRLITSLFPLVDETRPDPPNQWVEPKDRLNDHVDCRCEVVAALDMAGLVRENCVQLLRIELLGNSFRKQEHRTRHPEHARLDQARRIHQWNANADAT